MKPNQFQQDSREYKRHLILQAGFLLVLSITTIIFIIGFIFRLYPILFVQLAK